MITLEQVLSAVGKHCMIWDSEISELHAGKIRFETKFKYPDGGSVELFLVQDTGALPQLETSPRLTDLGETMTWLFHAQVKPWTSEKRSSFVRDVLELYDVTQQGGELIRPVPSVAELGDEIIRLGQACLRVSDLIFTKRMTITSPMVDQVEAALDDAELSYEPDAEIGGRYGKKVRLDFLVKRQSAPGTGILTLTSTTKSSAHSTANELFTKWYDVQDSPEIDTRVTVFDDRQQLYRSEDLERLEELSEVVPVSDTKRLVTLLEAA